MHGPEHRVRVYQPDKYPCELIAHYLAAALRQGGAALALVTEPHARSIRASLPADVDQTRFVVLDAVEVLKKVAPADRLDTDAFDSVLARAVRALLSEKPTHVFGEAVDLLVRDGRPLAAGELEAAWNRLRAQHDFDLLCGYEVSGLARAGVEHAIDCVVHPHSQIELSDVDLQGESVQPFGELDRAVLRKSFGAGDKHVLLGHAARLLSTGLELEATIDRVANLMIPEFADWCFVDVLSEDGASFERVAAASHRPNAAEVVRAMKRRFKMRAETGHGVAKAIREQRPQLIREMTDAIARDVAENEDHYQAIKALEPKSSVVAPMIVRGRAIGALTFTSSTRFYADEDLLFVEQLALTAGAAIENARILRREQSARMRIAKMQDVTAAFSRALSAQDVADVACRIGSEAMAAKSSALWLLNSDGSLRLAGSWGTPKQFIDRFAIIEKDATHVPATRVLKTGAPIWVETEEDYRRASPEVFEMARRAGRIASFAATPLWFNERAGGLIVFSHPIGHVYEPEEKAFHFSLANQCAQALERARLYDSAQRLSQETGLLFRLADAANRAEQPDQIFDAALEAVTRALDVERASILLFDPSGVMRFRAWRGLSDAYRVAVEGHSPWRRDATDPQPIFVEDVRVAPGLEEYRSLFESEQIRSLAFVPLYQGELLGKFMIYSDQPRVLSEHEAQLARTVATQISQAITRTRLFASEHAARAEAEAAQKRTAFLGEVSAILSSSLDWEQNLAAVARLSCDSFAGAFLALLHNDEGPPRVLAKQATPQMEDVASKLAEGLAVENLESGRSAVAPITTRGAVLGSLIFVRQDREYSKEDRAIAELIGRRAGIAIDNARLYQAEKAAREELGAANDRKNEFIAVLAHELRNPLAPILNAVEILRRRSPPDLGLERPREIIERQATHMSRMIDDLLDISRIARGKMRLQLEPIDFAATVRSAVEDRRDAIEDAKQKLVLALPDHAVRILGDETRVAQIAGNLLTNAVKFSEAGGTITVSLLVDDQRARLSVRDTGLGIRPEILERLFQPFSQDDRTLARSRGGLGLGLALVKGLVDLHGGSVSARSDGIGLGTEITVDMPLLAAPRVEAEKHETGPTLRQLKILVVEDNVDAAEMLSELLRIAGHTTAVANDGWEGLERAKELQPDVVLCDIGLPGRLDGYAVASELRSTKTVEKPPLIVALTGYGQAEDRARAVEAGFDLHLVKPVAPRDLERVLAAALAASSP